VADAAQDLQRLVDSGILDADEARQYLGYPSRGSA
jgi:hypothetical protein